MNSIDTLKELSPETVRDYVVRHLHKSQNIAQANIELIEVKGMPFVWKHFSGHPFLVRISWGRYNIGREWRNYEVLQGIRGIPKIYRRLDPHSFIMEYVEGKRLPHLKGSDLAPRFFERLKALVKEMHNQGVTHGDLRRKNILVAGEETPFLIDFAGAFHIKGKGNFITRAIFRRLKNVDDITVLKLQDYYLRGSLTAEEKARLKDAPWYLRAGRFLKKKVYKPFKHATHGKKRRRENS